MSRYYSRALFNPIKQEGCNLSVGYGYDHTPIGLFIQIFEPIMEENEDGIMEMNEEHLAVDEDMMFSRPPLTGEKFLKICQDWMINIPYDVIHSVVTQTPF